MPNLRVLRTAAFALSLLLAACEQAGPEALPGGGDAEPTLEATADAGVMMAPGTEDDATADPARSDAATAPAGAAPSAQGGAQELAASVNGRPILLADFQRQAFDTQRYFVDQGGIDPGTPEGQQQLLYLRRQVLNDMINQALLEQTADDMGITATDAEAEASLAAYIDEMGGEEAFEASLEETGSTREQVLAMERASLIGKKMLDEIAADVPATAEFVHARHILCQTAEACEAALARLDAGEDFGTVAAEVSEDQTSKDRGGDLDWITRGMLPSAEMEEAMFALSTGARSDVVQTDFGYHIIEVLERDPSRAIDVAQRVQLKEKKLLEWQTEQRATADIVIYIADLAEALAPEGGTPAAATPAGR